MKAMEKVLLIPHQQKKRKKENKDNQQKEFII